MGERLGVRVIVVTGGIGSGKSAVSRMLAQRGIPVYDCDSRAKALYDVYPHLKAMLKPGIFDDAQALAGLENALYPLLMEDFEAWAADSGSDWVAMESAILLQKPFFDGVGDVVLLVDAPEDIRRERVMLRGGISPESLTARLALQKDQRSNPRVDYIIENDGSLESLEIHIDEFLRRIDYGKRKN